MRKPCMQGYGPLQGHVIPIYYGEVQCDDAPAFIMEDVKEEVPFGQEKPFYPQTSSDAG